MRARLNTVMVYIATQRKETSLKAASKIPVVTYRIMP